MRFILLATLLSMPFVKHLHLLHPSMRPSRSGRTVAEKEMNVTCVSAPHSNGRWASRCPFCAWPHRLPNRADVGPLFVGYGPARGPHGHFRVDEWDLSRFVSAGANV